MWKLSVPLTIPVSKNKSFSLNLNEYRNAYYRVLNDSKKAYHSLVGKLLKNAGIPRLSKVDLEFVLYPKTRRRIDTSNVCCIVEKYTNDALVHFGILPDDDSSVVISSKYCFGHVDPDNPRVDVFIRPHISAKYTKGRVMKLILTEEDISTALRNYIEDNGVIQIAEGTPMQLDFVENGDVEVTLGEASDKPEAPAKSARKTTRRSARKTATPAAEEPADKKPEAEAAKTDAKAEPKVEGKPSNDPDGSNGIVAETQLGEPAEQASTAAAADLFGGDAPAEKAAATTEAKSGEDPLPAAAELFAAY